MTELPGNRDELARSLENLKRRLNQGPEPISEPAWLGGPAARMAKAPGAKTRKPDSRRVLLFGGAAALLHWGLGGGEDATAGPLQQLAQNAVKVGQPDHRQPGPGEMVEFAQAMPASPQNFSTDFSEAEPLKHWWQLETDGLMLEPFEKRMSAVPRGPSLAKPTRTMANGQAFFEFVQQQREAGFILRGQDERDCYRVTYTPQVNGGKPEMVLSARRRRRGAEKEIARRVITDLTVASQTRHHISVEMDGSQFAARLHWTEPSRIPGWPPASKEMVIATWKDDTFRDGAVGLWGPERRETEGEFRLLTVAAEV
jgi:hypothetical protein